MAELAGKPAPTEKQHRNLPPPPVGAGLPAMAAPLTSGRARWQASSYRKHRNLSPPPVGAGLPAMAALLSSKQSSLASQLLQKSTAICPLPLWERACPRWQRRWFQGRARWQASSYRKAASQSAPSFCGSGLARDGSAADFKAELAGKPAPTERHRNLPIPLWERACPRWQRRGLQASSFRKASISTCYFSQHLHQGLPVCGAFAARRSAGFQFKTGSLLHIGDEPLTLGVNCSRSR